MLVLMRCVAEAVAAKGVLGLVQWVPGGPYLYDVAADAAKRLRERRRREQIHDELREAAAANFDEAKAAAEQVAREVAEAGPVEDRLSLELYLSQVPGAVRKSLRRAEDHTGRSVPLGLAVETADDMARLLPPQMPRFRPNQPLPGRPGWALLEPLGAGGFGEVWKAGHDFIPDVRAVKFCTDPAARQRLLSHEGKLIARVMKECRGPNVVGLIDADLTGDPPWLAYEFVGGGDLAGLILSWQQLPTDERVRRATEAVRVLAETAGRFHLLTPPIVHRDLKPANILVAGDGTLKVTDFGIGGIAAQKLLSGSRDGATAYTRAVSLLSGAYTPIYASPQQQRGDPPDPRDDVHALGVIAYQMLTGRLDTGPGPRFDRDLQKRSVRAEIIELIGDCVDPQAEHRLSHGAAIADRLRVRPPNAEEEERQQHERWAQEDAEAKRRAQEEAERERQEHERRAQEEAEWQARQQAEHRRQEEEERRQREEQEAAERANHERLLAENLRQWAKTDWPRLWVEAKGGKWEHADWMACCKSLEESAFWPLPLEAVGAELERVKGEYLRAAEQRMRTAREEAEYEAKEEAERVTFEEAPATSSASPAEWSHGAKVIGIAVRDAMEFLALVPGIMVASAVSPSYLGAALGGAVFAFFLSPITLLSDSLSLGRPDRGYMKSLVDRLFGLSLLFGGGAALVTLLLPAAAAVLVTPSLLWLPLALLIVVVQRHTDARILFIAPTLLAIAGGWMGLPPTEVALFLAGVKGLLVVLVLGLGPKEWLRKKEPGDE